MPNPFFDFSINPQDNYPTDDPGAPSWMGDMFDSGGEEDNAAYGPDGDGDMYDSTSMPQPMEDDIPYDAMAAMNGLSMPQMPQADAMGRYGITDQQSADAGKRGFAQALFGAAGSFLGGGPGPALEGGMRAGDVNRQALDQHSLQNLASFKLQAEAKAKELDFIAKKSDIQRQQGVIEAERLKLEELKQQKLVAKEFADAVAPAAKEAIEKAKLHYPEKVEPLQNGFITVKSLLLAGDLKGADEQYNTTMNLLPEEWQEEMEEKVKKLSFSRAAALGVGAESIKELNKHEKESGGGGLYEMGPNGEQVYLSARDLQERKMKDDVIQSEISSRNAQAEFNRAQARFYDARKPKTVDPNKGQASQQYKLGMVQRAKEAAAYFSKGAATSTEDAAKAPEHAANLAMFGIDPKDTAAINSLITEPLPQLMQRLDRMLGGAEGGKAAAGSLLISPAAKGSMNAAPQKAAPEQVAKPTKEKMLKYSHKLLEPTVDVTWVRKALLQQAAASDDPVVKRAVEEAVKQGNKKEIVDKLRLLLSNP